MQTFVWYNTVAVRRGGVAVPSLSLFEEGGVTVFELDF